MKSIKTLLKTCVAVCLTVFSFASFAGDDIWIDVRSDKEWEAGHLAGAVHIPHTEISSKIAGVTEDKDAPIKLYCRSGGRAGMAKKELEEMGYSNVTNVGGLDDARESVAK